MLFATAVARILFGIALMSAGPGLIIFVIPLLISGWAIAHITIVVLMIFGVHAQRLAWVIGWLFVPFSGVYYSLDIMPVWMQNISTVVPMSYIFNALRIFIIEGQKIKSTKSSTLKNRAIKKRWAKKNIRAQLVML